jgi:hypothetical protein
MTRVRVSIFLLFQALYALTSSGNAFRVPDEFEVYYQVEHLVDAGDLSVPQAVTSGRFFGRTGVDGKPYAPYGPLPAVLALPHHLLARGVAWVAGIPRDTSTWTFVVSGLTTLASSTAAALAVVGFHRAALLVGGSPATALLLSLMLGGASVLWTYGTTFYSEAWQAAMFIWAAVYLLEGRVALASMLLMCAGLAKFTSLVFMPGFLAAAIFDRSLPRERRLQTVVALSAGIGAALAIHLSWNYFRFADVFEFGYNWGETIPRLPARPFLLSELPRGLAVLLFSPGKSILLWAPVLLLSATRVRTCPRPLLIGVATTAISGLIFYGAYLFPEGGYAHGPRHLVPIIPLLLLPAATPGAPWRRELITACAAVGLAISVLSVSVSFLQDQALGNDFQRVGYYERIDPPAGRAWNRYNLGYVPFIRTTTSTDWPVSPRVGAGVDIFPLHLMRAKAAFADASVISGWLPLLLVLGWGGLLMAAASRLWPLADFSVFRTDARHVAIPRTLIGAMLVALSLAYLCLFVPRGWIPHDEGMIGQSAERVLTGGIPHVDYEEPYTGGLTWLHAGVFKLAGIDLLYTRWLLFAGAAVAQALTYLILRRFLGPIGAAVGVWTALGWSFPNYFAALPSWWVLVCALGCLWAFVRYVETGLVRYAALAGLTAGLSILIKQTGLYVLVALVMALLYGGGREERETEVWRPGRALTAIVGIVGVALAFWILRTRLGLTELLYLLLPIAACSRLLLTAGGRHSRFGVPGMLLAPGAAVAMAALPLVCYAVPYVMDGHLRTLVTGLVVLPQKRLQFASMEMPPAQWFLAGLPLVALILPFPGLANLTASGRTAAMVAWGLAVMLPIVALYEHWSYQVIWQSARGLAAVLPVAICWLLISRHIHDAKQRWMLFGFAAMLAWASLVQFPFGAPIYFCYVTPLAVICGAAAAHANVGLRRVVLGPLTALLLIFALLSMNRGYAFNIGYDHYTSYGMDVPLNLDRASLRVTAAEASTYRRVVELVNAHLDGGQLVAGPDCPEVYFLTGQFSPSGSLFDFFASGSSQGEGVTDLPAWTTAGVVVMNNQRSFSGGLSPELMESIRDAFPHTESAGRFEVRWR